MDMLGKTFNSPTKPYTRTPRDFENKVIGLYFEAANNRSSDLFSALQELYDKNASSFELVYVSLCDSQEAYDQRRGAMKWLAVPFSHVQRRQQLAEQFEMSSESNALVLLKSTGETITRNGAKVLKLARSFEAFVPSRGQDLESHDNISLDPSTMSARTIKTIAGVTSKKEARELAADAIGTDPDVCCAWSSQEKMLYVTNGCLNSHPEHGAQNLRHDALWTMFFASSGETSVAKQQRLVTAAEAELLPVRGAIDACVGALAKLLPQEKAEMATFYEEPKLPAEVQAALLAAAEALKTAREAVALLKQGNGLAALEEARSVLEPPPELEAAVEAVCTLLEARPNFYDAQSRLLRNPTAFVDKLLEYNAVRLPPLARSKLTSFLATPPVPTTAPANDALRTLAATLQGWVHAIFANEAAAARKGVAMDKVAVTPQLSAVCEAVCDVFKIGTDREPVGDLRGTLMLAAAFPNAEPVKYEAMDALYAQQMELEEQKRQYEPILDDLQDEIRIAIDLLRGACAANSSLPTGALGEQRPPVLIDLSNRYAHQIAADLLALEGENEEAPWLKACRSCFTALFYLTGEQAALGEKGKTNVFELVVPPPSGDLKQAAFHKVMKHMVTKGWEGWEGVKKYTSEENWKETAELAASLEKSKESVAESFKDSRVQRIGGEQFQSFLDRATEYVLKAVEAYTLASDLSMVGEQVVALESKIIEVQRQMEGTLAVEDADVAGGASMKDIVSLLLKTKQDGSQASVAQAVWALKHAKGQRESALQMLTYLSLARKVVAALREPATLAEFDLASVPPSTKNRVLHALRAGGATLRKQAESFMRTTTALGKIDACKKHATEAKASASFWEGRPFLLPNSTVFMEVVDGKLHVGTATGLPVKSQSDSQPAKSSKDRSRVVKLSASSTATAQSLTEDSEWPKVFIRSREHRHGKEAIGFFGNVTGENGEEGENGENGESEEKVAVKLSASAPIKSACSIDPDKAQLSFDADRSTVADIDGGLAGKWTLSFSDACVWLHFEPLEGAAAVKKELKWLQTETSESPSEISELPGWQFQPYAPHRAVQTLKCDSLAAARHHAARVLSDESKGDQFAVWIQSANTLYFKQPAGVSIPKLEGEPNQEGVVAFFHSRHTPVLDEDATANLANTEVWLARWTFAVTAFGQQTAILEQAREKLKAVQRANQRTKMTRALTEKNQLLELEKECSKHAIDRALFPLADPWSLFPWELQLRPAAEREEQLRKATGLRNLDSLKVLLRDADSLGLTKSSSKVVFEATELRDLLLAEGAALKRSASTVGIASLGDSDDAPPTPQRERTERVRDALFVFLEDVNNDVATSVPLAVPYDLKLRALRDKFGAFIRSEEDMAQSEAILHAMERYVDMAYLREDEEPMRWAFSALGQKSGPSHKPTPFAEGIFYPASQFRLNSRSPLPFP
ncbi:pdi-like protein, partial [Chrysochromulina tobinii]